MTAIEIPISRRLAAAVDPCDYPTVGAAMKRIEPPIHDDGFRNYALAIAAIREQCIRRHQVSPDPHNPDEVRWAREGDRPVHQLDTALSGKPWER